MERKGTFDYIILETTGLANPGNIAPMFWVDEALESSIYLDGVVTLVDAKNINRSLNEHQKLLIEESQPVVSPTHEIAISAEGDDQHGLTTAHLQISHADVIVINKSDLVSQDDLDHVVKRVQGINQLARIVITHHAHVPSLEGVLLDLHAYQDFGTADFVASDSNHNIHDSVRVQNVLCRSVFD